MTGGEISYSGRTLKIGDNVRQLEFPIQKLLKFDNIVAVLMEPPSQTNVRDNVVAFDLDGEKLWRIEPVLTEERWGSLVYIDVSEIDGKLIVYNRNEASDEVDYHLFEPAV